VQQKSSRLGLVTVAKCCAREGVARREPGRGGEGRGEGDSRLREGGGFEKSQVKLWGWWRGGTGSPGGEGSVEA